MVDLSAMRGVNVDRRTRRAIAQGGATWGDYNRETQLHGLASTGGVVSTTGIGGLTLGGGLGWLMGKYGMAVDCLRAAEIVTAAGDVLRRATRSIPTCSGASAAEAATSASRRGSSTRCIPSGRSSPAELVAHPFAVARDVLRFYRDLTASLPDELSVFAGLVHAPDGSGAKLAAMVACHAGSRGGRTASDRP